MPIPSGLSRLPGRGTIGISGVHPLSSLIILGHSANNLLTAAIEDFPLYVYLNLFNICLFPFRFHLLHENLHIIFFTLDLEGDNRAGLSLNLE